MFGHLAATFDVKSAQKPSSPDAEGRASEGRAIDGSATDGMATDGTPLEGAEEQADDATAAAATSPMREWRIDTECLACPVVCRVTVRRRPWQPDVPGTRSHDG